MWRLKIRTHQQVRGELSNVDFVQNRRSVGSRMRERSIQDGAVEFRVHCCSILFLRHSSINLPVLIEQNILVLSFRRFFIVLAFSVVNAKY